VDATDIVDLDCDVDMEKDCDNKEEGDKEEEDEEEQDEDDEEDEDEDDGKEHSTIGQGEMVTTSADNVDAVVDDQQMVHPEESQEMHEHSARPKPPAPAPRRQSPDPLLRPRTPESHPLSGLELWGLWHRKNLARRCTLCKKLRQAEQRHMSMRMSSCSANRQVATVSLMSLSPASLSPVSLSPRRDRIARWGRSEPAIALQSW